MTRIVFYYKYTCTEYKYSVFLIVHDFYKHLKLCNLESDNAGKGMLHLYDTVTIFMFGASHYSACLPWLWKYREMYRNANKYFEYSGPTVKVLSKSVHQTKTDRKLEVLC